METRYAKPYFSSLELILHPIDVNLPVVSSTGERGTIPQAKDPSVIANITGWIAGQVARSDTFSWKGEEMDALLELAKSAGSDVVESWTEAFDSIADLFPQTAEQDEGSAAMGPAVYLRPDRFLVQVHPGQPASLVITVGVYRDDAFEKRTAYFELVFADAMTKKTRALNIANMENSLVEEKKVLNGTHPNWDNLSDEQKDQAQQSAEVRVPQLETQLERIKAEVVGDLSLLIGEDKENKLQASVKASVGALCTAILLKLKTDNDEYASIDVPAVMSNFKLPKVA